MPRILILLPCLLLAGCDANPAPHTPAATPAAKALGVGSPAPPLTVTQWLHGEPIELAAGKAYVLEFWAIWCGPCLQVMPHLDRIAAEYGPAGVEVIAVTTRDDRGNDLENVKQYVDTTGRNFRIRFAWCDDNVTFENWFMAAGQDGIPCSFVVDQQGKIAYIGHPDFLDDVLPKVVHGTWRGQADLDEIALRNHRRDMIFYRVEKAGQDAVAKLGDQAQDYAAAMAAYRAATREAALAAMQELESFRSEHPQALARPQQQYRVLQLQAMAGRWDDAKTTAESLIEQARGKRDAEADRATRILFFFWVNRGENPERFHPDVALKAAALLRELRGATDLEATLALAEAHAMAGDKARHDEFAAAARALARGDEPRTKRVEEALQAMQADLTRNR